MSWKAHECSWSFSPLYLIKCTAKGNILWSKSYPGRGTYPNSWFHFLNTKIFLQPINDEKRLLYS